MIDLLQEHLRLAREGQLRSLAVVSVSADGSAIGTQWSCDPGDMASLIGKLTVLTHDLMAARKNKDSTSQRESKPTGCPTGAYLDKFTNCPNFCQHWSFSA